MRHMETLLYLSNAAPLTTALFAFSLLSLTQNNQKVCENSAPQATERRKEWWMRNEHFVKEQSAPGLNPYYLQAVV